MHTSPRVDLPEHLLREKIAELEAALASKTTALSRVTAERDQMIRERDKLRRAYEMVKEQLELLRRRIFVAKSERVDVAQLELEFAEKKAELAKLVAALAHDADEEASDDDAPTKPGGKKSKGRRNLAELPIREDRVELLDPVLEETATRIGFEESYRLGYQRGGPIKTVIARATYKLEEAETPRFITVEKPKELVKRGLLAPSLIAHILVSKYRFGLPFHRLRTQLASEGVALDDGTMCRYAEDVGATLGAIVDAAAAHARKTAFCLATDATGVAIQPTPLPSGRRQPCDKGHFFVILADLDHVFFEFRRKHTSAAVCEMFRGYTGYMQLDAHCVYDALFKGAARASPDDELPKEVGCWAHARRKFWEAAIATRDPASREALLRIRALFQLEEGWGKLPPTKRHARRQLASRALLDDFFPWAEREFERVKSVRGFVASAFGYVVRQRDALRRFLDDGRLGLDNNASERALRTIAVGRKNWLFFGDDDHAQAAANLFSLIASCALHALDPELYLAEIIRVMPHWPRDRYLELAPKQWLVTRTRLRAEQLAKPVGPLDVPPALPAEQEPAAN